jgi:hypothetical protein
VGGWRMGLDLPRTIRLDAFAGLDFAHPQLFQASFTAASISLTPIIENPETDRQVVEGRTPCDRGQTGQMGRAELDTISTMPLGRDPPGKITSRGCPPTSRSSRTAADGGPRAQIARVEGHRAASRPFETVETCTRLGIRVLTLMLSRSKTGRSQAKSTCDGLRRTSKQAQDADAKQHRFRVLGGGQTAGEHRLELRKAWSAHSEPGLLFNVASATGAGRISMPVERSFTMRSPKVEELTKRASHGTCPRPGNPTRTC